MTVLYLFHICNSGQKYNKIPNTYQQQYFNYQQANKQSFFNYQEMFCLPCDFNFYRKKVNDGQEFLYVDVIDILHVSFGISL